MRFHLVDRVDSFEPWVRVSARKITSASEDYWEPQNASAVMPGPLALEALLQAGSWLVLLSSERRRRAVLLSVGHVVFHRPVFPGDVLVLEGRVESLRDEAAVINGTVSVDGTIVVEATGVMCGIVDAETLERPSVTEARAGQLLAGARL